MLSSITSLGFLTFYIALLILAIILMGEPKRWESALQIIVDVLRTNGQPNQAVALDSAKHIPIVACNMDLEFKDRAATPR